MTDRKRPTEAETELLRVLWEPAAGEGDPIVVEAPPPPQGSEDGRSPQLLAPHLRDRAAVTGEVALVAEDDVEEACHRARLPSRP